jgi:diguanylate cyclase (GGDEF)-like protein/PAS domain S-box-containing protein
MDPDNLFQGPQGIKTDLSILDRIPIGVFLVDHAFTILSWNKCLAGWTGRESSDMVGKNLLEEFPHLDNQQYRARVRSVLGGGPPVIFSYHLHTYIIPAKLPDGSHRRQHCIAAASRISGQEQPVAVFTLQDVTEVHRRVQEVSELQERTMRELELRTQAEARLRENEKRLQKLAATDDLTGAANRRKLFEVLEDEVKRCHRYGTEVSFLMVDADHFKHINDTFGHDAGDTVLRRMVAVMQGELRQVDLVGRFGGEEFGVILPQTSLSGAVQVAERMRAAIQASPMSENGGPDKVTVSIGVAGTRGKANFQPALDALVKEADQALYTAKRQGRNRVVIAGD